MAMPAAAIVEHSKATEDVRLGEIRYFIDPSPDAFIFQIAKERLDHSVDPALAASAHPGLEMKFSAEVQPLIAAVLHALVGMNRHQTVSSDASRTSSRANVGYIDQPTILCAKISNTTDR